MQPAIRTSQVAPIDFIESNTETPLHETTQHLKVPSPRKSKRRMSMQINPWSPGRVLLQNDEPTTTQGLESVKRSQTMGKSYMNMGRNMSGKQGQMFSLRQHTSQVEDLFNESEIPAPSSISSKSIMYKSMFYFIYVILPSLIISIAVVITLVSTLLCISTIMVWGYYYEQYTEWTLAIDYLLLICLALELAYNFMKVRRKLGDFINFDNVISLLILAHLICRFCGSQHKIMAFSLVLRAIRVIRLREITVLVFQNLRKYLIKVQDNDLEESFLGHIFNEQSQVNRFIIESMINFASGIIIESTYYLSFDEFMDNEGFYPYTQEDQMRLIDSMYFTIVTFSTIGYGDVQPKTKVTRLAVCLAIIVNITVLSNFLTKFIDLVQQLSPFDKHCRFQDHIVIYGKINEDWLLDLLEELVQNDQIQKMLKSQSTLSDGTKTLIVVNSDPSETIRSLAVYYTEQYGSEVMFLKENIFEDGSLWFNKANLKEAKILLGFAWGTETTIQRQQEYEKLIALMSTKAKDLYPQLRILLVLDYFKSQMEKDSLYRGIELISPMQFNHQILASSLANQGLGTMMQHLLTMRDKNLSKELLNVCKYDPFMLRYIIDMQQEVYSFKSPPFFYGMTYKECTQLLYLYGLELSQQELQRGQYSQDNVKDDRKMTLVGVESVLNPQPLHTDRQMETLRVANDETAMLKKRNSSMRSTQRGRGDSSEELPQAVVTNLVLCPEHHIISPGDVLYVICDNHSIVLEALSFTSRQALNYQTYAANLVTLQNRANRKLTSDIVQNMLDESIVKTNKKVKKSTTMLTQQFSSLVVHDCQELLERQIPFYNHFVIFCNEKSFEPLLMTLRKYHNNTVLFFTEGQVDEYIWKDLLRNYRDIYCFRGNFLNLKHLGTLSLNHAEHILIMSELIPLSNPDAIGICLAHILMDDYGRTDFLIELKDENQIAFLRKNPRLKKISCPNFFYPSFVSGNVYFQSFLTTVIARQVYSTNWLSFFEAFQTSDVGSLKNLHSLKLTSLATQVFNVFGELQLAFIEHEPSFVVMGMIKNSIGSRFQKETVTKFMEADFIKELSDLTQKQNQMAEEECRKEIKGQIDGVFAKILGNRFVLTNPSFYCPLEENDILLVIGTHHKSPIVAKSPIATRNPFMDDIDQILEELDVSADSRSSRSSVDEQYVSRRLEMKSELISELKRMHSFKSGFQSKYF